MKRIFALLLAALMVVCLFACDSETDDPTTPTGPTGPTRTGPLYDIASYSASDDAVIAAKDTVVGQIGDYELTVRLVQIAYWTEFFAFLESQGDYVITLGMDPTAPLDTQQFTAVGCTWQQFFLNEALNTLHEYIAISAEGHSKGVSLPEELQKQVDSIPEDLKQTAEEQGFASADELIRKQYGPGCTAEDMQSYMYLNIYSYYYYSKCVSELTITDEMVNDYFNKYELDLSYSGIVKDGEVTYICRNIYIPLEEEDWDKCETEAQAMMNKWLASEQTETAFAALATEFSKDGETAPNGGLRDGMVALSNLDKAVVSWYMDPARQIGDTELIKCADGYDILYFCGTEEYWHYMCRLAVRNVTSEAIRQEMVDRCPIQVDYSKILLSNIDLSAIIG